MPFLRRDLIEQHMSAYMPENYETPMARAMRAGEEWNLTPEEREVMAREAMAVLDAEGVLMATVRKIAAGEVE